MTDLTIGVIIALVSVSLTAILTHWANLQREKNVSHQKIIGWLEWLKSFLEENKNFPYPEQRIKKLPWWADHALQSIGDSLYSIDNTAREKLKKIVRECWTEHPVKEYKHNRLTGEIIDTIYDDGKVKEMKKEIEELVKQISDP
jgi:DNA-binding ferritin-like protein (Dps family)